LGKEKPFGSTLKPESATVVPAAEAFDGATDSAAATRAETMAVRIEAVRSLVTMEAS
jgi:hypothetical protein